MAPRGVCASSRKKTERPECEIIVVGVVVVGVVAVVVVVVVDVVNVSSFTLLNT